MGVTVSTEDVSLLQDFGSKSKEEQEKVIEKAGFVVEETDKRIAEYMALADSQAVVVRRLCELVYNKTKDSMIEEAQQQMVLARQEWEQHTEIKERSMKQELQKLLDVVNKKDYLISHETSVVEEITSTNESERSGASNGNGLFEGQNFYDSDSQSSGFNERLHKELNIGSCVTKSDTNENEMKGIRTTKGKNMSIHRAADVENQEHYHIGIRSYTISGKLSDQQKIDYVKNLIQKYNISYQSIDARFVNGHTYIVVAVSSNDEVEKILDTSGKDREFPYKFIPIISLNATLNEQVIWLTKVDKSFSQQEVCEAVINTLGEVQHIKKIEYRYNNSFRVTIKVTCSDVTFNNTWSIEIGKGRAEVWPERLSTEEKKKRKTFKAWINNVDKDTTESSFARQLYNFNAKSWLLVDSGNTRRLEVTFDNNQDMLRCVKKEFVFEGRGYRWEMENNDNKQIRNFNKSIKKEREIMCYNCGSMGHMAKFCQNNNFQQQGYRNQERVKSEEIGLRCYSCARDCRNEYSNSFNGTGKQGYENQEKFQSQNHQRQDYNIEYQRGMEIDLINNDMQGMVLRMEVTTSGNTEVANNFKSIKTKERSGKGIEELKVEEIDHHNSNKRGREQNIEILDNINIRTKKNKKIDKNRYKNIQKQIKTDKNIKKLAVYNVQGLGKEDKYGLLVDALKENKWDILGLCETKLKSEAAKFRFIGLDNYISYSACNENSSKEGVTLLIKKSLAYHVTNIERIEGVAIKVDLVFKNKVKNFRCILIYRPIEKLENVVKVQEIQDKLTKWNDCDYDKWDLVVMGDLNEHYKVEEFLDKGLNSVKGKKCKIINWLLKNNFIDSEYIINSFNVDSNFTWKSGNNCSRIDYIWIRDSMDFLLEDFKAFEFEDFVESDHRLIEIKLKDINEEIKEREEVTLDVSEVSTILDRNKVQEKWKEFAEIIENKLKVSIANEYDMGIEGTWKMIKDCFMEGEKILPKKEIKKMRVLGNDLLLRDKEFKKILQIYQRSKKIRTRFKKLKKVIAMQLDEISQIDKVLYDNNRKIINHNNLTMQEEYKFNTYKLEEINQENWESLNNKVKNIKKDLENIGERIKHKQIREKIIKRQQLAISNPGSFIRKIFENKKRHVIDFSRLVCKHEEEIDIIVDKEEIKNKVYVHYKEWTKKRSIDMNEWDYWKHEYELRTDIDECIYESLMEQIELSEFEEILASTNNWRAPGISGITYDFMKHSGNIG
ncbi:unnamed protein product [Rhizophagus irregularis]|nr:unnamed protein product [Rhizophagus irregularis]